MYAYICIHIIIAYAISFIEFEDFRYILLPNGELAGLQSAALVSIWGAWTTHYLVPYTCR